MRKPGAFLLSLFLLTPAARATELADLAWLTGCWRSEAGGRTTEECWLEAAGGLMLGMNRSTGGERSFFELLRIADEDGTLVYYASPGGRDAVPFRLGETGASSVTFVNPHHDFPQRISYRREDQGVLHVRTDAPASGSDQASEWSFTRAARDVPFYEYDPPSTLVVPENPVTRARFPFIDVHNHQFRMPDQDLSELVTEMDRLNMGVMVNLSGRGFRRVETPDGGTRFSLNDSDYLRRAVENARESAPGRFAVFTNLDTYGIDQPGWREEALRSLETDVAHGAAGLKIYKSLGMDSTDGSGERIAVDDERLDPIWRRCGELGIPVLIHTADPAPFWRPRDPQNERWFELIERPRRYRDPEVYPPWEQLIEEQWNVFRKHPETHFINAHLGWMGNDLGRLGRLLDELPNVSTEIGAVLAELGRQPRYAREFLIRYQDRVMFGKDSWNPEEYHVYFRVLETDDDYIKYYRLRHAFWRIYGLDLPDEVLKKIYYKNALAVIPGLDASRFPE